MYEDVIRGEAIRRGEGQHKVVCPICSKTRKKKHERTLSLRVSSDETLYQCWHCQVTGMVKSEEDYIAPVGRKVMTLVKKDEVKDLNDKTIKWLKSRGISEDTARSVNIKSGESYIRSIGEVVDCVMFPYMNQGQIYATKNRAISDKGFACNGAPASFFNLDSIVYNDDLYICEGEIDALTMIECGFESSVSVPNGAVMKVVDGKIDPKEDNKFKFLWDCKEKIDQANRVIIATDADGSGQAMAEEIARRIGKDRCWKIEYPDGCKDANDVLMKHGRKAVEKMVIDCKPWPVAGLYDASHFYDQLDEIYENGMGTGASTGYAGVDELYSIVTGQLTVVTGHPSSGKSEFIDQIMVNLAEEKSWKFAICSFENEPRIHIAKLISKHFSKPFFEGVTPRLTKDELARGKEFVRNHFSFLYQNDGSMATIEGIVERLKIAVMRHGIRGAIIDPYNYIQKVGDVSETDWISDMLTQLRIFAQSHDIHLWFVAHPTKMMRGQDGKVPAPRGYDISGSAAWFAKADVGLTVHRPDAIKSQVSEVHIWKCRFSWVGKQGVTELFFNPITSRYSETNHDPFSGMGGTPTYSDSEVPF